MNFSQQTYIFRITYAILTKQGNPSERIPPEIKNGRDFGIMHTFKEILHKYGHGLLMCYLFFYLVWFFYLENRDVPDYYIMHCKLDDWIPFNEWFVIPYCLWFVYIAATVLYFFFSSVGSSHKEYYQVCGFLFGGMTICLFIYTFWPSMQDLRPQVLPRDNFLTKIVAGFYAGDTCTNVCPSIHVYNSIGACIAILRSERLKKKKIVRTGSVILSVLICLSTVFIKQHSVLDMLAAAGLALVMYLVSYPMPELIQKKKTDTLLAESENLS